ncbi:MAG: hypothetical protein NTZ40_11660 [Cyanobacteria bacterium]|nr:hypothetical protein [Cyanobacteriota bacterium]
MSRNPPWGGARGLRDALADTPVVLVNGPRQSGRITLLRQFATDQPRLVGMVHRPGPSHGG